MLGTGENMEKLHSGESRETDERPVERLVMQEIRDEFTANAEHFDTTMMKILEQNERLIKTIEYLDAKINSALIAHERAVPVLLDEAINRTHFDA